jgi:hypothetical protein
VVNVYLKGTREPGGDVLARLAGAAGLRLDIVDRKPPVDAERASRILVQVLELAEALPFRPRSTLQYPSLPDRVASGDSA